MANSDIRTQIEEVERKWVQNYNAHDDKALAALYTNDAQVMPDDVQTVSGRTAIEAMFRALFSAFPRIALVTKEVEGLGDGAYEVGAYTLFDTRGAEHENGKYIVIWRKAGEGWQLHRDIFNGNHPPKATPGSELSAGEVGFLIGGRTRTLGAGEGASVEAGVVHDWWQVGEAEAQVVVEVVPGARFAEMVGSMFGLARDGKVNAKGLPDPLQLAVMGCIVNGPGESKHADIGISLPGTGELPAAPVFIDGKKAMTLRGTDIARQFKGIVEDYVQRRWGA